MTTAGGEARISGDSAGDSTVVRAMFEGAILPRRMRYSRTRAEGRKRERVAFIDLIKEEMCACE